MEKILPTGTRLYDHGDMANESQWGTITAVESDTWGTHYTVETDGGGSYRIDTGFVSAEFKGHSGTRIVTEEAYNAYRAMETEALARWVEESKNLAPAN